MLLVNADFQVPNVFAIVDSASRIITVSLSDENVAMRAKCVVVPDRSITVHKAFG